MADNGSGKPTRIAIGLGSNQGDRARHLAAGREGLAVRGVSWHALSSIYETAPVGPIRDQAAFLNQVAVGETCLAPRALLNICLAVEREQGRVRGSVRWGPRTLDLDILLYNGARIAEPGLEIPHPELARRAFVLVPLAEVSPDWPVPGTGQSVRDLLRTAAAAAATAGREEEEVRAWRSSATKPPT